MNEIIDIDAQELADSIIEDIGYWLWYNNEIENLKKNTIEELRKLNMNTVLQLLTAQYNSSDKAH